MTKPLPEGFKFPEGWGIIETSEKMPDGSLMDYVSVPKGQYDALVQRLEQAESVIEHYADESNWVGVNLNGRESANHDLFVPSDNGYDKARQYLSEKKTNRLSWCQEAMRDKQENS